MEVHPLDNQIWHMLNHNFDEFVTGTARVKRCDGDLYPVSAFAENSDDALGELKQFCQKGEITILFAADSPTKVPGFKTTNVFSAPQFVCQQRTPVPDHDIEIVDLTPDDTDEIAQLIELTAPGPFFPGLVTYGDYVGIRQESKLVAMAGIRTRLPSYAEITAVCTHPDWRRNGYGSLLTSVVADRIWERGDTPYLHPAPDNHAAIRVYDRLHFVERSQVSVVLLKRE